MSTSYTLDPPLRAFVEQSLSFLPSDSQLPTRRAAFLAACQHFTPAQPHSVQTDDLQLNHIALRLYRPRAAAPADGWPVVLYFHGGGWDLGSLDSHDWFAYHLMPRLNAAILAVDYRLAPEYPYPAALHDGLAVWNALREGQIHPQLSRQQLLVAGDSAGGTLAASLCMALRAQQQEQPLLQALVYPVLSTRTEFVSMQEHADAPLLNTRGLAASIAGYLPDPADHQDPFAMPLEAAHFGGLAPAFIGVAQYDPLRDQGIHYRDALQDADVSCQLHIGRGLLHSSLRGQGIAEVERFYEVLALAIDAACRAEL